MSIASQTITLTDLRRYAFSTDRTMKKLIWSAFSYSPALAIFANQQLGDFGGTRLAGAGHTPDTGGVVVQKRVVLGENTGAARMVGPTGTHNLAQDNNTWIARGNYKYYSHAAVIDIQDRMANRDEYAISNFVQAESLAVVRAVGNLLANDVFSSISPATAITGLPALLSANDT